MLILVIIKPQNFMFWNKANHSIVKWVSYEKQLLFKYVEFVRCL